MTTQNTTTQNTMQGYDIILSLTGNAVNSQLYSLFWTPLDPNDPQSDYIISHVIDTHVPPLQPGQQATKPGYRAIIGQTVPDSPWDIGPYVSFKSDKISTNQVLFNLPLKSGTYDYIDSDTGEFKSEPIENWTISFAINISQAPLDLANMSSTCVSPAAQEALENVESDIFSIYYLALSFEDADLIASTMLLTGGNVSSDDAEEMIGYKTSHYFQSLADSCNPFILGYPVMSNSPIQTNSETPYFEPTYNTFSSTPYRYSGTDDGSMNGLSTLNYLMMTSQNPPPSGASAGIFDYNWPIPSGVDGIMSIARWDFNNYICLVILPEIQRALGLSEVFKWVETNHWNIYHEDEDKGDVIGSDSGILNIYADFTYKTSCDVCFKPENKQLTGSGYFYTHEYIYEKPFGATTTDGKVTTKTKFDFTITFGCGTDGKLTLTTVVTDEGTTQDKDENDVLKALDWFDEGLGDYEKQQQKDFAKTEQAMYANLNSELLNGLNAIQQKIISPGGQDFFFKDLYFNFEQDMVMSVTYKSAQ
jgi:hypothetical protein